MKLFLL